MFTFAGVSDVESTWHIARLPKPTNAKDFEYEGILLNYLGNIPTLWTIPVVRQTLFVWIPLNGLLERTWINETTASNTWNVPHSWANLEHGDHSLYGVTFLAKTPHIRHFNKTHAVPFSKQPLS